MRYCKQCGFDIVPAGHYCDRAAQELGFCSYDCMEFNEAVKTMHMGVSQ